MGRRLHKAAHDSHPETGTDPGLKGKAPHPAGARTGLRTGSRTSLRGQPRRKRGHASQTKTREKMGARRARTHKLKERIPRTARVQYNRG
eukprot:CAMPEP_0177375556 /NCGR_PEP_ID=MMETSP0368-20130122/44758_1 /TAXON_ID=447022 ORGANISM="Scrippsiella hangoei-like, Strain SHHI-4" /NCGR_SAMPLE_ID=MMETSP0368 /ASSEMBLY_ACC=CAM_ASM_000363 /LENGTH=89 /DNA_ID=CAMNT_0018839235 /DNA_START=113 /DNA_END=378 /DNA_ORIENTATION=+